MKKQKVLLVHNFYQIGGGEHTVFENELKLLQENGHQVFAYTRSNDELKESKIKLLLLPFSTIWSFRTWIEVRRLIRAKRIDIIHCHNTFPLISPSVYYAARSMKVPVVQTIHNFRFICPNGLFYCKSTICEQCRQQHSFMPALKNKCYRDSFVQTFVVVAMLKIHRWLGTYKRINYIFLTKFNKNKFCDLIDNHEKNLFVKPNFVHTTANTKCERAIKTKFVYAGRLDENKGIPFLLEVWPTLPEEYELHIYGDGPYQEACKSVTVHKNNIHYLGFRPKKEIFQDLAEAAALLFPSTCYEGFPMILAESFSIGRPVVCVNLGNHGDIIHTSCAGVLYEANDHKSFQNAVKEIVHNNILYASNAATYYSQYLTPEKNYEMLCEIYDKAR